MQYRVWLLLLLALSQSACGFSRALSRSLLSDTAHSRFSSRHSCPDDRMTLKAISLNVHDLVVLPDPPPDVAADPGRLAVWREVKRNTAAHYVFLTAVDVMGCGFQQTYLCWEEPDPQAEKTDYLCDEIDLNDANVYLGRFKLSSSALQAVRDQLDASGTPH